MPAMVHGREQKMQEVRRRRKWKETEQGRGQERKRQTYINSQCWLFAAVMFYKVSSISEQVNAGLSFCKPLVTTRSSANQDIILLYVCF